MILGDSRVSTTLSLGLALGTLLCIRLGRRFSRRGPSDRPARDTAGLGAVQGAAFGLLGLLIAFTFGSAMGRMDERRALIVSEANAIGTAWMRLDLLPSAPRDALRALFPRYLDSRLAVYRAFPDLDEVRANLDRSALVQAEIWDVAAQACSSEPGARCAVLVLPPINEMIDLTTTRTMAMLHHPPIAIYGLLFMFAMGCALLVGYATGEADRLPWIPIITFATLLGLTVFVIMDIEYPRSGLIRLDSTDEVLADLRKTMP